MKTDDLLLRIIKEAGLSNQETTEVESAFFEVVRLKMFEQLGNNLDEDQKKQFLSTFSDSKNLSQSNIDRWIAQSPIVNMNVKELFQTAVKEALLELVELLDKKLPIQTKTEIAELLRSEKII